MVCPVSLTKEQQRVLQQPQQLLSESRRNGGESTKTDNKENTSETYPSGIF